MKNNHKIVLGLAIGAGIAYLLNKKYGKKEDVLASTPKSSDLTRNEKVAYVIDALRTNNNEEMTGFDGDRFSYDPKLGYALPVGKVSITDSGDEILLNRDGNLAQEVFFNMSDDNTMIESGVGSTVIAYKMKPQRRDRVFTKTMDINSDPTAEALSIMDEMSDAEINIAYNVIKTAENNPAMTQSEAISALGLNAKELEIFNSVIYPRIQDVKVLKKTKSWDNKWRKRRKIFGRGMQPTTKGVRKQMGIVRGHSGKGQRIACDVASKARHPFNKTKARKMEQRCDSRKGFINQITNRTSGSMWGGFRNDGKPTIGGGIPSRPRVNPSYVCERECDDKYPSSKIDRLRCKKNC